MFKLCSLLVALIFLALPANAQELYQDLQGVWRAEVVSAGPTRQVILPGTDVQVPVQSLKAKILDGGRQGEIVSFDNDYTQLQTGDKFYLNYLVTINDQELYSVREIDRRGTLIFFITLFVAVILIFGGWQGLRSLLALAGSLLVIIYLLPPSLVAGYPPVPISIVIAGLILFCAIFFTHGFKRSSLIAFAGTLIAVALSGLLAHFAISLTHLSGFASDESVYLNLNTGGQLDFVGLLLAAIIIGALGVLDDIAVTQVTVVREFLAVDSSLTKTQIYRQAMRVGREHVGALVNTLVLAYTGAALPLLLLFSLGDSGGWAVINREIFATEIVRAIVGSIGLILTVPLTTLLAVWWLKKEN